MPEIHVDIVISKFTYVWLLKLLTKQFSHLFIWLKIIFIEFQLFATKSIFVNAIPLTYVTHSLNPKWVGGSAKAIVEVI